MVTGASSGIGRATVRWLAEHGSQCVLVGRSETRLRETVASLGAGERHFLEVCDLENAESIPGWLKQGITRWGQPIDGLVHAAGAHATIPIRFLDTKSLSQQLNANFMSSVALLRGVAARGVCNEGASCVFVSSLAAHAASPGMLGYAASKAALEVAVRTAAAEFRGHRMRFNCVAPGYVDTPMLAEIRKRTGPAVDAAIERQFLGVISAEEVAALIVFLLSDSARHITGSVYTVDGGLGVSV